MEFLESTYEAGANLGNWPRKELERSVPAVPPAQRAVNE
jgi:hypothetical protein